MAPSGRTRGWRATIFPASGLGPEDGGGDIIDDAGGNVAQELDPTPAAPAYSYRRAIVRSTYGSTQSPRGIGSSSSCGRTEQTQSLRSAWFQQSLHWPTRSWTSRRTAANLGRQGPSNVGLPPFNRR